MHSPKKLILFFFSVLDHGSTMLCMAYYYNYTTCKRYLLSGYMKSHSYERPHKCSVCEKGFKTLAMLQNHANTHTGIKPHHSVLWYNIEGVGTSCTLSYPRKNLTTICSRWSNHRYEVHPIGGEIEETHHGYTCSHCTQRFTQKVVKSSL